MILYSKLNDYFVFNLLLHISLEYQTEHALSILVTSLIIFYLCLFRIRFNVQKIAKCSKDCKQITQSTFIQAIMLVSMRSRGSK